MFLAGETLMAGNTRGFGNNNRARDPWKMSHRVELGPGHREAQMPRSGLGVRQT